MNEIENELWPSTPQPKSKSEKDGTHGLIIGGPFDGNIELESEKSWRPNHEQEIQEAVCVGGRAYR